MVSGTWISSHQKGTIALRVYREISANQSVMHWGREAERGRRTQRCLYCMDAHTHTLRCPHMLLLFCVLCVWGVSGVYYFGGVIEKAATTQLDWQGNGCHGGEKEIKKSQNRNLLLFVRLPAVSLCRHREKTSAFMNGQLESVIEQCWRKEKKSKQIRTFICRTIPSSVWMNGSCPCAGSCCEKSSSE